MPYSVPPIFLYDMQVKRKREFIPENKNVRMYVCGPTVYDRAHIGNARSAVVFDMLYRLLKKKYAQVSYVRNITDVDDKIIQAARAQSVTSDVIARRAHGWYLEDMAALSVLPPTCEPKATNHIGDMVDMIQRLVDKKIAYVAQGHVMFHVKQYKNYGALSGRALAEQLSGARVEVNALKKTPEDFVLWKPSKPEEPAWESPWGLGRPGWHIECSAMSYRYLGIPFDIHGGGQDLLFPHHENETAQSCACFSAPSLANFWTHNGLLRVNGEKMSKSLGNILTVSDLLKEMPGSHIRFCLLSAHYRKPLDWSKELVARAAKSLDAIRRALRLQDIEGFAPGDKEDSSTATLACQKFLSEDLNSVEALGSLVKQSQALLKESCSQSKKERHKALCSNLRFMGFDPEEVCRTNALEGNCSGVANAWIEGKVKERSAARKRGDFGLADSIRQELSLAGVALEDLSGKTVWRRQ